MRYLRRNLPLALLFLATLPLGAQIDEGIRLSVPNPLFLSTKVGDPPQQQIFVGVTVSDPQCAEFTVSNPNVPWMSINKFAGVAPDGVIITIDYSTFAPNEERFAPVTFQSVDKVIGSANGSTTCLAPQGTGVVIFRETLPITVKLLPGGPTPSPFPQPQILNFEDGSGSQQPMSKFVDITNAGDGSFNYLLEVAYSGTTSGWLTIIPTSGTVSTTPQRHQAIVNPAGLPSGTHQAVIRVLHDAPTAPIITIPVSVTLSGPPRLSVTPIEIAGTAKRGKQNPNPATLNVANTGGGSLTYQVQSSVPWMTVSPTQGQTSGATPIPHTVTFNALNLPVGVQNATLTVSSTTAGVANNPVVVPVRVTVEPGGTIGATPAQADVTAAAGSNEPQQVRIRVESPDIDPLRWRARVDPPGVQWLRLLETAGTLPAVVVAEVDPAAVPRPVAVSAGIVIEAFNPADTPQALGEEGGDAEQAAGATIRTSTTIRLQTIDQQAQLETAPLRIELIARPGDGVKVQPISVGMGGGAPALPWEASLEPRRGVDAGVFRISPAGGVGPGVVTVSADPTGLTPGVYDADVAIRSGATVQRIPAALLVTAPGQSIVSTGQTAVTIKGSAASLSSRVQLANLGAGATPNVQLRSSTQTGGNWLSTLTASPESFEARALGVGLNTGVRHGLLEIVAPGASNSPQYLPVVYERQGPGAAVELELDKGGVVLTSVGGAAPSPASFAISTTSDNGLRALLGVSTDTGVDWLSASPADTQVSARGPVTVNVTADASGLAPGVHRGRVSVGIPNGPMQSAAVTLVVAPPGPCAPRNVHIAPLAPPDGFQASVGHPVTVDVGLIDDCGFPVRGGVTVGGSARNAMMRDMGQAGLEPRGAELFRGTMTLPAPGASQVVFRAVANGLGPNEWRLTGTAVEGSDGAATRAASPLVHAATFELGRPIAPGSIATVFGTGFPNPALQPASLPLPESLQGFAVRIGGRPAPLFFLNSTQANLQVPAETPANTLVQSLVRIDEAYLPAETFLSAEAQPGVFALSADRAVAVNQDGTINSPLNPAKRAQIVVAYLTGIGATLPPVLTGQPAPGMEPFARPAAAASAQIGGANAEIVFLGLTPGFIGLAQANLKIAGNAATGAEVPLVVEVGTYRSPAMGIAVEP